MLLSFLLAVSQASAIYDYYLDQKFSSCSKDCNSKKKQLNYLAANFIYGESLNLALWLYAVKYWATSLRLQL